MRLVLVATTSDRAAFDPAMIMLTEDDKPVASILAEARELHSRDDLLIVADISLDYAVAGNSNRARRHALETQLNRAFA
jgi:hypothetical protein